MNATTEQKKIRLLAQVERIRGRQPPCTQERFERELASLFSDCCNDWQSLGDYIAQPEADLYSIAEIFHYAPEFVRGQPRWRDIEQHPQWQAALARPKRQLPQSAYRVPAYYLETLLTSGAGKAVAQCLERGALKAAEHFERLVARRDQSIDGYLASRETRPEWLEHFSKSTYASVRLRVAQNKHTSPETLRALCLDKNRKVLEAATSHPNFPADAAQLVAAAEEANVNAKLDQLDSLDWKSLGEFFTNVELPGEMLALLAERNDPVILFACSMHPNAPDAVWRKSLAQPDSWQRAAAALNPAVPEGVLRELAASDEFDIAFALASNPKLPEDVQIKLANHSERTIRHHVADRARSVAVWAEVVKHPGPKSIQAPLEHFLALAIDPKTPAKKLKAFYAVVNRSRSGGEVLATAISTAIALHKDFPPELLAEFRYYVPWFEQQNKAVSLMALEGTKLPKPKPYDNWKLATGQLDRLPGHVANHMLVHGDVRARRTACGHPRCDRALLIPLLFSTDTHTLKKLAEREHMPRFFYEILWATNQDSVRTILAENRTASRRHASFKSASAQAGAALPAKSAAAVVVRNGAVKISGTKKVRAELAENAPELATLTALAQDKMLEVRRAVAKNPDIAQSIESCMLLAGDPESSVRQALAQNRRLPWEVIAKLAKDVDPAVVKAVIMRLHQYPVERTDALERELLAADASVAAMLAQHTGNEALQLAFAASHGKHLMQNRRCTPAAAIALLRHCEIDPPGFSRLAGILHRQWGSEAGASFITKAVRLSLDALLAENSLVAYAAAFPDAGDDEKARHRQHAAAFVKDRRARGDDSILDAIRCVVSLTTECADSPQVNDLILEFFDSPSIPARAMQEVLPTLVYSCKRLPGDLQRRFATHELEAVRTALAIRADLADDVIATLRSDPSERVRSELAEHSPSAAPFLAKDPSESVRAAVARQADAVLQRALCKDSSSEVLSALARNPRCEPDILEGLAQHKRAGIRASVASNRATPEPALTLLLDDVSVDVRYEAKRTLAAISQNREIQLRLSEEGSLDTVRELAMNPACHPEILERLARRSDPYVLRDLADNPNLPPAIEAHLMSHPLRTVREAMRRAVETRQAEAA